MPRPAKPWFRVYTDALDSRKLQRLKPQLKWTWFNLMCLANITRPRGSLPSLTDIAYRLRTTEKQAFLDLKELREATLLDENKGIYSMHNWDDWQYESDVRASSVPDSGPVAAPLRAGTGNVSATNRRNSVPLDQNREEQNRNRAEKTRPRAKHADPIDQLAADFGAFGAITAGTAQAIEWSVKEHGKERVQAAVRKAAASGKSDLPWSYVDSILEGGSLDEPRRNGRISTPEQADSGLSAEHERLGLGKPVTLVASPYRDLDNGGARNG